MGNCCSVQFGFENFVIRGLDSIVGQANYVQKLKETLPTLSSALEELRARRSDMQRDVDLAEQRLLVRLEQVQLWLSKAENMITEAENLIADGPREIDNLCLGGCVSKNCTSSYKFGKKVVKMIQDIKYHMSKAAFEKVAENQSAASVVVRPDEGPIALESTIDNVWSCIMDKDVGIIGLHGLWGVGKTTLLTQINNKFSTTRNDFDVVIWALVSKDCSVGGIQDEIGRKIGFTNDSWKNKGLTSKHWISMVSYAARNLLSYWMIYGRRRRLVEYWFCEGLLNEFDRISEARMQGDHIINSLLNACLLEKSGECFVKMHDVIRDMTLWIACKHEAEENIFFFVKTRAQLFKEPDVKAWEGTKRVSVMKNQIEVLRETPKCPNLRTLFLCDNKLQGISHSFFRFMPHITVLNLSKNSGLGALPEGVSQLISLECLDLSWSGITELPLELKSLTKLKMLDLSYMNNLRKIVRHFISSFSMLQIFKMRGLTCGDHPDEDNVLSEDYENLIQELKSLQHLNILSIPAIKSMFALENFLCFHLFRCCTQSLQLSDFRESNALNVLCFEYMDCLEDLHFINCGSMVEMKMEKLQSRVPPTTNYTPCFHALLHVVFENCNKLTDVTCLILTPNLRYIKIMGCAKMEEMSERKLGEVADVVGNPYPTPFLKLEILCLFELPELKSIYLDKLPFPCLQYFYVRNCRELKKLPLNSDSAQKGTSSFGETRIGS
ncbi:hypothetical protein V6N13_078884 [Hibiscus sabdariffa]